MSDVNLKCGAEEGSVLYPDKDTVASLQRQLAQRDARIAELEIQADCTGCTVHRGLEVAKAHIAKLEAAAAAAQENVT